MTKTFIINKGQKPSKEQIREVMEAKKYPIEPDEDAPDYRLQCIRLLKAV